MHCALVLSLTLSPSPRAGSSSSTAWTMAGEAPNASKPLAMKSIETLHGDRLHLLHLAFRVRRMREAQWRTPPKHPKTIPSQTRCEVREALDQWSLCLAMGMKSSEHYWLTRLRNRNARTEGREAEKQRAEAELGGFWPSQLARFPGVARRSHSLLRQPWNRRVTRALVTSLHGGDSRATWT